MQHWYIMTADGQGPVDIATGINRLAAIREHCYYYGEEDTPDQWNKYIAKNEEEFYKTLPF